MSDSRDLVWSTLIGLSSVRVDLEYKPLATLARNTESN